MANTIVATTTAVAADSLVSLSRAKRYAGEATTDNDAKWAECILAASRLAERYCDRLFLSASRTEYYDGMGRSYLSLAAYPITVGPSLRYAQSGIEITFSDTTNYSSADVKCDSSAVVLSRTSTGGVGTINTISLSGYSTLTTLAAAITAVGNGWSASVTADNGNYPPSTIRNTQGQRDAYGQAATIEVYASGPGATRVNTDTGTVWLACHAPWGMQNIKVQYVGGYTTIPDDVQSAVAAIAASLFRISSKDQSVKSEKIGDYSFTLADPSALSSDLSALAPDAALLLAPYRRLRIL